MDSYVGAVVEQRYCTLVPIVLVASEARSYLCIENVIKQEVVTE